MLTSYQREAEFRIALARLLRDHGAEMEIADGNERYSAPVCTITMESRYDVDGELIQDFTEFNI